MAGNHVSHGRALTTVGYVQHLHVFALFDQFAGKMLRTTAAA